MIVLTDTYLVSRGQTNSFFVLLGEGKEMAWEVLFPGLDPDYGLDSILKSLDVFLVPMLCQRGQGASAMPPGSPNTA